MRKFAILSLLILAGRVSWAACTLPYCGVVLSTNTGTVPIPASSPYTAFSAQSMRIEFRIKAPGGADYRYLSIGPLALSMTSGVMGAINDYDTLAGSLILTPTSTSGDFVGRIQRNVSGLAATFELCALSNGAETCQSTSKAISVVAANSGASFQSPGYNVVRVGADFGNIAGELHFLRWCSGVVPVGTTIQVSSTTSGCTDYGDWELNNNGTDSSSNGLNLTFSTANYSTSLGYSPYCNAGGDATNSAGDSFSIGSTGQLDAADSVALREGGTLSYSWAQTTSQTSVLSSSITINPTFTTASAAFGPINFNLVVNDGSNTATCDVYHGLVTVNSSNTITSTPADVEKILLPQVWYGHNPWPAYDYWHRLWADHFGGLQSQYFWLPDWDAAQAGTISVTNGSAAVTGAGVNFQTLFCSSGTTGPGDNTKNIVIWYPRADGTHGRRSYGVSGCASTSTLTMTRNYSTSASTAGVHYSIFSNPGNWAGGAANINYYDNVVAFYSLYYRTGIQVYRDYGRTLADRWWTMPFMDEGYSCLTPDGFACFSPRQASFTGLVLRALDNRSDMWTNFENYVDTNAVSYFSSAVSGFTPMNDVREDSYRSSRIGLLAMVDPNATPKARFQSALKDSVVPYFVSQQDADKSFHNFSPTDTNTGTIAVDHGSTTVHGIGTSWTSATFLSSVGGGSLNDPTQSPNELWVSSGTAAYPRSCVAGYGNLAPGDTTVYVIDAVDVGAQTITLHTPYAGGNRSGVVYTFFNVNACGIQPFMMGVVAGSMDYAYKALNGVYQTQADQAKQLVLDASDWMRSTYWPETRGMYYGRVYPGCEPDPTLLLGCRGADAPSLSTSSIQTARFTIAEAYHGLTAAYNLSPSTAAKAFMDFSYGGSYGWQGGPYSDSNSLYNYFNDAGFASDNGKFFGFTFGWGLGSAWPAASNGESPAIPTASSYSLGIRNGLKMRGGVRLR